MPDRMLSEKALNPASVHAAASPVSSVARPRTVRVVGRDHAPDYIRHWLRRGGPMRRSQLHGPPDRAEPRRSDRVSRAQLPLPHIVKQWHDRAAQAGDKLVGSFAAPGDPRRRVRRGVHGSPRDRSSRSIARPHPARYPETRQTGPGGFAPGRRNHRAGGGFIFIIHGEEARRKISSPLINR
jgi:hypothetical protein